MTGVQTCALPILALQGPRLRLIAPGFARLTPVVPPGLGKPGMRAVTERVLRARMRWAARALGGDVHALVVASQFPVFGTCGERRRLFYATDDFVAGAELMGVPTSWLRRCEQRLLRDADTVVTISPALTEAWKARGLDPVLVANGVDHTLFRDVDAAPPPADVQLPRPIVGFVGHLSERIDLRLLEAIAERGTSLLLVGPRQITFEMSRIDALLARPNVQWVGPKPFTALPSYLSVIDVGVTPYGDSAFNRASFPLKTLEYLAAGRAAVATDLPSVRWLGTDLVTTASSPREFADAVEQALRTPRTPELVARRQAVAAQHSWDRRTAEIARLLGLPAQRSDD